MNKSLQESLSALENMIAIQKNCVQPGDPSCDYMHGMANGLIVAHSCFTGDTPKYYTVNNQKDKKRVRHKSSK